jgi:hypothetical protein
MTTPIYCSSSGALQARAADTKHIREAERKWRERYRYAGT